MHIRLATMQDFGQLMSLYYATADAMIGTPADCCWRRGGHPSEELVSGLIRDAFTLVAFEGDELVGAVGVNHDIGHDYGDLPWLADVDDELVAVIHLLVIDAAWRGRGHSRQLLRACLDETRSRGMRTARLDATANNAPAIALYQSEGFVQVGAEAIDVGFDSGPVPFVVLERLL